MLRLGAARPQRGGWGMEGGCFPICVCAVFWRAKVLERATFWGGGREPEKVAPGRLLSDPAGHLPPGAL